MLLGGERFATVEVEIYRLVAYELDMARASVLVWLVLAVTAAAGGLYAYWSRRVTVDKSVSPLPPRAPIWAWEKWLTATVLAMLAVCCLLPLAAVWLKAVSAGSSWAVLLEAQTWAAVWNTIRFSAAAVATATVLGVLYAAAARQMAWLRAAAARTMGANGFQTACYVTAPLLKPALRRGLTLASATCIGEFAATLFLSRPEWQTLTTLIYDYLGRAGADNYGRAMVLTAVLTALALTAFLLVDEAEGQKAV